MTAPDEDAGKGRPARRPGRPPLPSRDRLARAAFELVDREGSEALTIGRLARELGVGPITIYGYAASKDAIVAMLPDLLLEHVPPIADGRGSRGPDHARGPATGTVTLHTDREEPGTVTDTRMVSSKPVQPTSERSITPATGQRLTRVRVRVRKDDARKWN